MSNQIDPLTGAYRPLPVSKPKKSSSVVEASQAIDNDTKKEKNASHERRRGRDRRKHSLGIRMERRTGYDRRRRRRVFAQQALESSDYQKKHKLDVIV